MTGLDDTTPQLRVIKKMQEAFSSLDIKNVEAIISKNFTYQTFPKATSLADETREGFVQKYGAILALVTKVEPTFHEVIDASGKVVVHITVAASTADGTKFDYDSVSILTFGEEDGELKVLGCKDFSDPQKRSNLHNWAAKALAKNAA